MNEKEILKLHKKIFKQFKGMMCSSLVQNSQIDINFKKDNFIINYKEIDFLKKEGFKFDSICLFKDSGITLLYTKK